MAGANPVSETRFTLVVAVRYEGSSVMKVVMVTATQDQEKMDEACRLGACEYITKPLELDHLEQTVIKMLQ